MEIPKRPLGEVMQKTAFKDGDRVCYLMCCIP